jgi:hypothetical protein
VTISNNVLRRNRFIPSPRKGHECVQIHDWELIRILGGNKGDYFPLGEA